MVWRDSASHLKCFDHFALTTFYCNQETESLIIPVVKMEVWNSGASAFGQCVQREAYAGHNLAGQVSDLAVAMHSPCLGLGPTVHTANLAL